MAASNAAYSDVFNPFSTDYNQPESLPDFSDSRVVLSDNAPSDIFDMTEFPIYFDEGLTFRQMMEQSLGPSETSVSTQTTPPGPQAGPPPRTSSDSTTDREAANEATPVLSQPSRNEGVVRRNIPVYTMGWSSTNNPQMMPATGLDFLTGVHEVLLQQTLTTLSSPRQSAKRYIIKVPNGETLYSTVENSKELQRACCGSQRGFAMSLLDPTQQEAATLHRSTGCVFGWIPCLLQVLRVYTPGSLYLGSVSQDLSFAHISYTVRDNGNDDLFRIFGPNDCAWAIPLDSVFTICGGRGGGRLGLISRLWNNSLGDYNLQILFPASGIPDEHKMLLIAAALLIEYMFFEHRSISVIRIC